MDTTDLGAGAIRIVLDISRDAQPIRGHLRPESGQPEPFTGWLELTRVLERLVNEVARTPVRPADRRVP